MSDSVASRIGILAGSVLSVLVVGSTAAAGHVRYVTDDTGEPLNAVEFAVQVLSRPENALLFGGVGIAGVLGIVAYLRVQPTVPDVEVLREILSEYADLVPWMLRLSMGLPLVGAGFTGYYFSPAVQTGPQPLLLGVGFFILFGLATRAVAAVGLGTYLVGLASHPELLLAIEYVPGLSAIVLLGGGRPSADHMLNAVASAPGTLYGRIDPVHRIAGRFSETINPYERYVPTVIRVGLGVAFIYLGVVEKLARPGQVLAVVEKYDLTAIVPVDPGAWVLGAGLAETALGALLVVGLLTRGVAAAAFVVFSLTLFGIPDDPVLAHVTMFGLASAVFTMGSGPLALDNLLGRRDTRQATPAAAATGED